MDKEKLIERIKEQNKGSDERENHIKNSSYYWAQYGVFFVLALILIFRMISGDDFSADMIMVMMGHASIQTAYLYKQDSNKQMNLYMFIVSSILFLISTYQTMAHYEIF